LNIVAASNLPETSGTHSVISGALTAGPTGTGIQSTAKCTLEIVVGVDIGVGVDMTRSNGSSAAAHHLQVTRFG
jgi:hypothetical protein